MGLFSSSAPVKSWVSPKAQKGMSSPIHGKGLFAINAIKQGELVAVKAGHIIDKLQLAKLKNSKNIPALQISDGLYVGPQAKNEFDDSLIYFNHSCEPNLGLAGNIMLVAMKDIVPGEELTADYAMFVTDPNYSLQCNCKALSHRPVITGDDWQIPTLQRKYAGYFSWYIEQKLKKPNLQA
jgi:hypothetical protein